LGKKCLKISGGGFLTHTVQCIFLINCGTTITFSQCLAVELSRTAVGLLIMLELAAR